MAATGRDGGRGPSVPWRYRLREQTGGSNSYDNSIISSSSSGTIVSTTYTSSGSRLSSISMDAVRHFELALDEDAELVRPTKKSCNERERMKHMHIKSLIQEFFGAPSAELSININNVDMSVLERWFSELDVAWVLHLPDGDDASAELHHTSAAAAERWIRGFRIILETICSTSTVFYGLPDVCEQEDQPESDIQANNVPDQIHFGRFLNEAMSKMLSFVDITIRQAVVCNNEMPSAPYKKLHTLLGVYNTLSDAPDKIRWSFDSTSGVCSILQETVNLLSSKKEEAYEAIWSTMERLRTLVRDSFDISYGHDSSSPVIPQASSDIHKATLSIMEYISFLHSNDLLMRQIVSEAIRLGKYVPPIGQKYHLDSMIKDMKSCLEEKLVKMSESFPDQSLRFLFLLNNIEYIRSFEDIWYLGEGEDLSEKVLGCMENYLQACWEPVLSCLFSPTPLCFGINHSPLLKFESAFKKTYTTQKLWKVPDPKLREGLRRAITKEIVPRYTEYIEENNITTPVVTPQDLEKMLQELFEG